MSKQLDGRGNPQTLSGAEVEQTNVTKLHGRKDAFVHEVGKTDASKRAGQMSEVDAIDRTKRKLYVCRGIQESEVLVSRRAAHDLAMTDCRNLEDSVFKTHFGFIKGSALFLGELQPRS